MRRAKEVEKVTISFAGYELVKIKKNARECSPGAGFQTAVESFGFIFVFTIVPFCLLEQTTERF